MFDWVLNTSLSVALSSVKKSNKFSDMQQTSHIVLNPNLVGVREAGGGGGGRGGGGVILPSPPLGLPLITQNW